MKQQVKFGSKTIPFTLVFGERKMLTIKVHPDASVEVLAPASKQKENVLEKVKSKAPWILKQISVFNSYKPATPVRRYVNGETHLYLGRQYRLKTVSDNKLQVKVYRGQLWLFNPDTRSTALEKQLQEWQRERAAIIFVEVLEEIVPKFRKYKIGVPVLSLRAMTKRWGSCTAAGRIVLNPRLIKASRGCIEYVLIHELCHLVHRNHDKTFYSLLGRMMPDWKKWKERLESSQY